MTDQIAEIAQLLLSEGIMPAKAAEDALHVCIASVHRVDFLLSWNFKHIANPVVQARVAARLSHLGMGLPFICAPEELASAAQGRVILQPPPSSTPISEFQQIRFARH